MERRELAAGWTRIVSLTCAPGFPRAAIIVSGSPAASGKCACASAKTESSGRGRKVPIPRGGRHQTCPQSAGGGRQQGHRLVHSETGWTMKPAPHNPRAERPPRQRSRGAYRGGKVGSVVQNVNRRKAASTSTQSGSMGWPAPHSAASQKAYFRAPSLRRAGGHFLVQPGPMAVAAINPLPTNPRLRRRPRQQGHRLVHSLRLDDEAAAPHNPQRPPTAPRIRGATPELVGGL